MADDHATPDATGVDLLQVSAECTPTSAVNTYAKRRLDSRFRVEEGVGFRTRITGQKPDSCISYPLLGHS
jgi:hypothetical protein